MMSPNSSDMIAYRLRKLALSGMPSQEIAQKVKEIIEIERAQKLKADDPQQDFILPFLSARKAHLNIV